MSERGFASSQADWIVGINLTRAYTIIAKQNNFEGVLSVGRVQTPILGLIVARDKEFESFKSIDYYSLLGNFEINNNIIKARLKTEEKILDKNIAKEIKETCENQNSNINFCLKWEILSIFFRIKNGKIFPKRNLWSKNCRNYFLCKRFVLLKFKEISISSMSFSWMISSSLSYSSKKTLTS